MTALELNQAFLLAYNDIKDDEGLLQKALAYIKKLAPKRVVAEPISKEELLAGIRSGLNDVKAGRGMTFDAFLDEVKK